MNCPYCSTPIPDGTAACPVCHAQLNSAPTGRQALFPQLPNSAPMASCRNQNEGFDIWKVKWEGWLSILFVVLGNVVEIAAIPAANYFSKGSHLFISLGYQLQHIGIIFGVVAMCKHQWSGIVGLLLQVCVKIIVVFFVR